MKTVAVIHAAVALGSWALGQAGGLGHPVRGLPQPESVMESWIAGLSHHAELRRPLLVEDVHMVRGRATHTFRL